MTLMSPNFLALLIFAIPIWFMTGKSQVFGHSQVSLHSTRRRLSIIGYATKAAKVGLWSVLCLAMCQVMIAGLSDNTEPGGTILFEQDVSGSIKSGLTLPAEIELAGPGFDKPAPSPYANGSNSFNGMPGGNIPGMPGSFGGGYIMDQKPRHDPLRIDASIGALKAFIAASHGLRIALTAFDDQMYYYFPATTDHRLILDLMPSVREYLIAKGGGTNFDGPNGSSELRTGALQGAIDVLKETPDDQNRIFIMDTDGDSSIDEGRQAELVAEFKRLHIHVFVFGIGEDWASNADSVQPLIHFVRAVGGEVVPLGDKDGFQRAVSHIDALARATTSVRHEKVNHDAILQLLKLAALLAVVYFALSALSREQF